MKIAYILIFFLILIDIATKSYFMNVFALGETKEIIPHILKLGYIQNTGASFGMLEGQSWLFLIATLIALLLFGYFFSKGDFKTKKVYTLAFSFMIAGALGNALDRIWYGFVVDFVQIPFLPIVGNTYFNVADTLLNVGIVLLFVDILFLESKRKKLEENIVAEDSNHDTDRQAT